MTELRVTGGPTPEELAAVIAVLTARAAGGPGDEPAAPSAWTGPVLRPTPPAGPDAWRTSALPR